MVDIYLPSSTAPGEGWETEYIHGPQPVLDSIDGNTSYCEGVAFGGFDVLYDDVPAGYVNLHIQAAGGGDAALWVDTRSYADPNWGDDQLAEVRYLDYSILASEVESPDYYEATAGTSLLHSGGPLVLGVDLGGFSFWWNHLSYLGVSITPATGFGRLKVLTPMGWEFAIPGLGENDGRTRLRLDSGWTDVGQGSLKILTEDGWVPVN